MAKGKRQDKAPAFPLWLHPRGQWCKKIKGRFYYFGRDRDAALREYVRVREDLEAGRKPRPVDEAARTVADVVNSFLTEKRGRVDAGELSARTWSDYYAACEAVVESFGRDRAVSDLRPEDFARLRKSVAERLGPVSVLNFVTRVPGPGAVPSDSRRRPRCGPQTKSGATRGRSRTATPSTWTTSRARRRRCAGSTGCSTASSRR
jgi:hypothetical protein